MAGLYVHTGRRSSISLDEDFSKDFNEYMLNKYGNIRIVPKEEFEKNRKE